jgi:hypothetical protein
MSVEKKDASPQALRKWLTVSIFILETTYHMRGCRAGSILATTEFI